MLHFRIVNSTLKPADLAIIDAGSPLHWLKTLDIDARDAKLFNKNNPSQSDRLGRSHRGMGGLASGRKTRFIGQTLKVRLWVCPLLGAKPICTVARPERRMVSESSIVEYDDLALPLDGVFVSSTRVVVFLACYGNEERA
jgi:hypothetical protein